MSLKAITIGAVAVLACAMPIAAQQRGTLEFGAFGSAGIFDKSLTLNSGIGAGGRVGVYLDPRVAIEFEDGEMRASRTLGLTSVNVGILTGRLVFTPIKTGNVSFLLGAGAGIGTETNFLHSYGLNGLVGLKIALSNSAAIRIDAIDDVLANNKWKSYQSLHVGLSFYRNPFNRVVTEVRTVEVAGPVQTFVQKPDSVSADEQMRRRRFERDYLALRDSLARVPVPPQSSPEALATMQQVVNFHTDRFDLSPEAKSILDAKVLVFRANPRMRIIIVGNTDVRATDSYNMALGERRSKAAKDYLVAQGIDAVRIEISTDGERNPAAAGTSKEAYQVNRRDEFRLLVGSDRLVPPTP